MKIAIGINTFKKEDDLNHREKMCIESLRLLKQKYPEQLDLINITFTDEDYKHATNLHDNAKLFF